MNENVNIKHELAGDTERRKLVVEWDRQENTQEIIELCTFPDSDDDYCKVFAVTRDWLVDVLDRLDQCSEQKGVDLENFLENYVWVETWFIYEQAKAFGEILREEEQL